jgi:hypothetical protein
MVLKYQSGEEIKNCDRVLLHGEPAEVVFVSSASDDPSIDLFYREHGEGIMLSEPKVFGHAFIPANQLDEAEYLKYVSRADSLSRDSKKSMIQGVVEWLKQLPKKIRSK